MRVNVVIWCHHLQHTPPSWICHHQVKMWLVRSRIVVLLLQVTWGTTPFLPFSVQMALHCAAFCSALGFSYPSLSWWLQDCSASSCHYLSSSPSFLGVVSMLWAPTVHPCGPHNLPIISPGPFSDIWLGSSSADILSSSSSGHLFFLRTLYISSGLWVFHEVAPVMSRNPITRGAQKKSLNKKNRQPICPSFTVIYLPQQWCIYISTEIFLPCQCGWSLLFPYCCVLFHCSAALV